MNKHYINGSFVDNDHALISVNDLGLARGLAVCDIFRTYRKRPFHLTDNLNRLEFSAQKLALKMPEEKHRIAEIIDKLLDSFDGDEALIRTIVTGGMSSHRFMPEGNETLIISALTLVSFPEEMYLKGVSVCTTTFERPFPQCKTLFYASAPQAIIEGKKYDAFEAIYLNRQGEILEGLTSNFFAFIDGKLITSSDENVLCGITREVVLRVAKNHFPIERRPIPYHELKRMDEAFITSCTKEILPVTQMDGFEIGKGSVGPQTKRLMELFRKYTKLESRPPLLITRHEGALKHQNSSSFVH